MNLLLRGARLIDPLGGRDQDGVAVRIRDGVIDAVGREVEAGDEPVLDLTPQPGRASPVVCPAFIDLHAHLREPGGEPQETVASGAAAAAAGGFGQVVAMANTVPAVDTPERMAAALDRAGGAAVRVLQVSAVTRRLRGAELVDVAGCAAAGAAAFSDDGRNGAAPQLLQEALRSADGAGRAVLVHPEDESLIARANPGVPVVRAARRAPEAEVAAVRTAIEALAAAGRGRLHLQHLSCAGSLELLREARERGLAVTAEASPHHLAMWSPFEVQPDPPGLAKVNPPLRTREDREALVLALREGLIDAVATDHAPHLPADKLGDYEAAAAGMIGLELALATCLTLADLGGAHLPVLVDRLTAGPWRVLGAGSGLDTPWLRVGDRATLTVFDPAEEWTVAGEELRSLSRNTPLLGVPLRGRVLLTAAGGRLAHLDARRRSRPGWEALDGDG